LPQTDPPGTVTSFKESTQQRNEGPFKLSRNGQQSTLEPPMPTAQPLSTSALPVGEAFLPGLASSATSGHAVPSQQPTRCHGHLRLRRTKNNNTHKVNFLAQELDAMSLARAQTLRP